VSSGADFFLKKTLGEDFLQSLEKFELWKPGTRTTIDHEEIKTALKIVPRALMSFLIHNLTSMEIGETKELQIPVSEKPAMLRITKHERDVYSGELEQDNKRIVDMKYRSIPGVGLVVMSALELYDTEKLEDKKDHAPDMMHQVQRMIDDRLALHDLIGKVVEKKIAERDAIQQLILAKLSEEVKKEKYTAPEDVKNLVERKAELKSENKKLKKKLALNEFLENRKQKLHKNEHVLHLSKDENVSCPDCGQSIFKNEAYSGCVCLGSDMSSTVHITKSEGGVKMRFGKDWDPENIEMLLEVLRGKHG
jgi:mRNA-degrading endonuclease HigB of HigAB toxin-antitoxin module